MADIKLPPQLESVRRAIEFPAERHRWNTNEEVASILIAFNKHGEWQKKVVSERPSSGSTFLYNRKQLRYRKDGYCWKKRKDGKTTREDHMKLKVQGIECIYGCYVHSAILPTFHRRCYWLLQNADLVLVHYLNVPLTDDNKLGMPTLSFCSENKSWSEEELIQQLRPMFASMKHFDQSVVTEHLMEETINHMVRQLITKQGGQELGCTHDCTCPKQLPGCNGTCKGTRIITPKHFLTQADIHNTVQSRLISYIQQTHKGMNQLGSISAVPGKSLLQQPLVQVSGGPGNSAGTGVCPQAAFALNQPVLVNTITAANTGSSLGQHQTAPHELATATNSPLVLNLSQLPCSKGVIILSSQAGNPISIINNAATSTTVTGNIGSVPVCSTSSAQPAAQAASQSKQVKQEQSVPTVTRTEASSGNAFQQQHHNHSHGQAQDQTDFHQQTLSQNAMPQMHNFDPNLQSMIPGTQPVAAMASNASSRNCDNMKSEDQVSLISLLNITHPGSDSHLDTTLSGFSDIQSSQDMDSSLDLLQSTLLGLTSATEEKSGENSTPTVTTNSIVSNHEMQSGINNDQTEQNLLQPSLSPDFSAIDKSTLFQPNQVRSDRDPSNSLGIPCSMDGVESTQRHVSCPNESDLIFDHFDILGLSEFENSHLNSSFSSTTVVSTSQAPIASTLPLSDNPNNKSVTLSSQSDSILSELQKFCLPMQPSIDSTAPNSCQPPCSITVTAGSTQAMNCASCHNNQRIMDFSRAAIAKISDLAPDWAYTEGGSKVLVSGPWYSTTSPYTVHFGGICVSASLVQSGVLRCYCPAHLTGVVKLHVACEGYVISDSYDFEYKPSPILNLESPKTNYFSLKVNELRSSMLDKLQAIEKHLAHISQGDNVSATIQAKCSTAIASPEFEVTLAEWCKALSRRAWVLGNDMVPVSPIRLTLLHMAAALGFHVVITELINWRINKPCPLLQFEIDAFSRDDNSCTPLMWTCALGHSDAAHVLYQWVPFALQIPNKDGMNALDIAISGGHIMLAQQLVQLETTRKKQAINLCMFSKAAENKNTTEMFVQDLPVPGDVSQALAATKFAMPGSSMRQIQQQKIGSKVGLRKSSYPNPNLAACTITRSTPAASNMENLEIEIPQSPPAFLAHKNAKVFNSVQSTPKERGNISSSVLSSNELVINQAPVTTSQPRRSRLLKHTSVEVLPDFPLAEIMEISKSPQTQTPKTIENPTLMSGAYHDRNGRNGPRATSVPSDLTEISGLRTANSDPHISTKVGEHPHHSVITCSSMKHDVHGRSHSCADPMISMCNRDLNSPLMFLDVDTPHKPQAGLTLEEIHRETVDMETDSPKSESPSRGLGEAGPSSITGARPSDDLCENIQQDHQMITLANQIIAAMPERIKYSPGPGEDGTTDELLSRDRRSSYGSYSSNCSNATPPGVAEDSGISTPLEGMAFEEYRYPDINTPASSLSPASSCLQSPYPYGCYGMDSPPPTTAEFTEYFNAPSFYLEKDFSQLTLTDEEQRRLYEAAQIIQEFYRRYKDKKELQQRQRQKEMEAAILIQSYYRRCKQYMYYKKMTQAAVLIQSQFRSYYAQKRFRKSREAATIIQNRYRAYKEYERFKKSRSTMIQQRFRSHYQRKREESIKDNVEEFMDDTNLSLDDHGRDVEQSCSVDCESDIGLNSNNNNNNNNNNNCDSRNSSRRSSLDDANLRGLDSSREEELGDSPHNCGLPDGTR